MANVTYTTIGSVRGSCGHAHRTIATAKACADADQRACSRHGGYSDRSICHSDGSRLSEREYERLEDLQGA
jgi:hypothetical protein